MKQTMPTFTRIPLGTLIKIDLDHYLQLGDECGIRVGIIIGTWTYTRDHGRQLNYGKEPNIKEDKGYVVLVAGRERPILCDWGDFQIGALEKIT